MSMNDDMNMNDDDGEELPFITLPTATEAPPSVSLAGLQKQCHPNHSAYASHAGGQNMLQNMDLNDQFANIRHSSGNYHYPFASEDEWQLAYWLTSSSFPQTQVDAFLHLHWVCLLC